MYVRIHLWVSHTHLQNIFLSFQKELTACSKLRRVLINWLHGGKGFIFSTPNLQSRLPMNCFCE